MARRLPTFVAGARLLAAWTLILGLAPAAAFEHARFEPHRIEPAWPGPAQSVPALLTVPQGWLPGDAAVLILSNLPSPQPGQNALVAALIMEGAAVLELDVLAARGFAADSSAEPPAPDAPSMLPDLRAALRLLGEEGAGMRVAIGWGEAGQTALLAAIAEEPGLAAGIAFGPGRPDFAAGVPPPVRAAWPFRAARLCAVIADVAAFGLTAGTLIGSACRAALGPPADRPSLAHGAAR